MAKSLKEKRKNYSRSLFPPEGIHLPDSLRIPISNFLYKMQMRFYRHLLRAKVGGGEHIPLNNNHVIIATNHSSHLDYGLVWYSLGKYGRNVGILAARDYFFNRFLKATFYRNFINLIPIEREGKSGQATALASALQFLDRKGGPLLIFPEGSRSVDGKLMPFKLGLGYLVFHSGADVLPIRLFNTHRILPKGKLLIHLSRTFRVHSRIGSPISNETLVSETKGFSSTKTYHHITQRIFEAIQNMDNRDRK